MLLHACELLFHVFVIYVFHICVSLHMSCCYFFYFPLVDVYSDLQCDRKGRRIKTAYVFAMTVLQDGLEGASSWTVATFNLGIDILRELQGCVRGVVHLGGLKIKFFDRVPVLLARLGEPGIKARCIEQWQSAPAANHHRVTKEFLDPAGELSEMV